MTKEQIDLAAQLYRSGLSYKAIEPHLGLSAQTIRLTLKAAGVPSRPGGPAYAKLSDEQVAAIDALYTSGKSLTEIGKLFGVSHTAIWYRLNVLGIERRASRDACRTYVIDAHYFHEIDTPEKAYWLGFFAADGNIIRTGIRLALGRKDDAHVVAFVKAISAEHPIYRDLNSKGRPQTRVQIGCYQMAADLAHLGIIQRKSYNLEYPPIPADLNRHFIRGYFDGDGSVNGKRQVIAELIGRKSFLARCAEIIYSEKVTRKLRPTYPRDGTHVHILAIGGNLQARRLYDWLYQDSTIWLPRKRVKFEALLGL